MKEITGNLWSYRRAADWTIITTNGTVKADGCAVMGRGTALQASKRYPTLPKKLGDRIKLTGNGLHIFNDPHRLIALPVKHNWWEVADIELIRQGVGDLAALADVWQDPVRFYMPRPGCGNGQLKWADVRPILDAALDDRFTVVEIRP